AGPAALAAAERLAVAGLVVARQQAFPVTQARVEDQVAEGEDDGADEQHEPPLGQRVVELLDAIEGVADGVLGGGGALTLAHPEDQPGERDDGAEAQYADVDTPERSHSLLLPESCSSRFLAGTSSAKGRLAASSKLLLRFLL